MLKQSDDVTRRLIAKNTRQRAQIDRLRKLLDAFDGEFWKQVVERIQTRIGHLQTVRENAENLAGMSGEALKVNLARELGLREAMSIPEDCAKLVKMLQAENAKLAESIRARRQKA